MSNATVEFSMKQVVECAQFIAELTRQGIAFSTRVDSCGIEITITGY